MGQDQSENKFTLLNIQYIYIYIYIYIGFIHNFILVLNKRKIGYPINRACINHAFPQFPVQII